ncbi:hypothetical protein BDM02DRAFT_3124283 [Thelephora ganbajun]|uniref:Uncharacterized protein n=1 Tax=Thelephora ganbajun TaxID=370292 RepID=A0ACB6YZK6_THEGA|nr:hypothetical protein BDM02DRAFT_3124283 [Thelephora ganbajun]
MRNIGVRLWKESPTGYTLHLKLISGTGFFHETHVSPNGELIIAPEGSAIQLWHTTGSITPLSDASISTFQRTKGVDILGFSPDEALIGIARMRGETVTVLDLGSGIPRLTIDTGMGIYAVGVAGSAVVVVGEGKIVTWNLPAGNDILNPRANVNDSVLTTTFNHPPFPPRAVWPTTSVSPGLHRIAMVEWWSGKPHRLHLYDLPTGQYLASTETESNVRPWFSLDEREVLCVLDEHTVERCEIIEDSGSDITRLDHLGPSIHPPGGFLWQSSRGYEYTNSGWVLNPSGKRLLWLPPRWRSDERTRIWSGRFLALFAWRLPEPVILELEE